VVSLGQKLGALEVSEAAAIKRAEHAEKMYQLSKGLKTIFCLHLIILKDLQ